MTSPPTSTPSAERPRRGWRTAGLLALGCICGWAALLVVAVVVILTGLYDVRATTPHQRFVAPVIHRTMIESVKRRSGAFTPPPRFTSAQVLEGFQLYDAHCVMCHGGPGVPRDVWVKGMTPTPPFLLDSATRWTPQDLRLIVGNGVKMTAMPAWSLTLTDSQLWSLVAFLDALPDLSPADYAHMRAAAQARTAGQAARRPLQ